MDAVTTFRLDECDVESNMSSTSSRLGGSSTDKYVLKTLCFSRKSLAMPSKDEYTLLLSNGLGARKWQVGLSSDAEEFRRAILNIYPRLATTTGYTLWNVKKDKTFEKLPVKVNTPSRIRAYLGYQFTGCLIIMPLEEMSLVPSLSSLSGRREFLTDTDDIESGYRSQNSTRVIKEQHRQSYVSQSRPSATFTSNHRQFCMICRRTAKQQGSTGFYDINKHRMTTVGGYATVAEKLMELLNLSLPRTDVVPSEEICKRCYRQLNEIDFLEIQLKRSKAEFVSNFFQKLASSRPRDSSSSEGCHRMQCENFSENLCVPQRVYLTPAAYRDAFERHDKNQSFSSRTLNIVPVRLNYGANQLSSVETMSDCFPMSEKSSTLSRRPSEDLPPHHREESHHEGNGESAQQGRRDRWYKFEGGDRSEDTNRGDREDETGSGGGSVHNGSHNSRRDMNSSSTTEDNFEAAIVEAKRKGVARVEAFLDMMTYKNSGNNSHNNSHNNNNNNNNAEDLSNGATSDDRNESSKNVTDDDNKNCSTATSSSQSPSPPTFSSSSPEESLNSLALSKMMARPRPWKKRHRHFEVETNNSDLGGSNNSSPGSCQSRPAAKREFETSRSPPISHKLLRPNKEHSDKLAAIHNSGKRSSGNMVSDEENTGTSFSSGSDSSISSNNSKDQKKSFAPI